MKEGCFSLSVVGLGTDIIEIARIKKAIERYGNRFLTRIFTPEEQDYCKKYSDPYPHLAGRFAAKESIIKALGSIRTKPVAWHEIMVRASTEGRPLVCLGDELSKEFPDYEILVSISHCREFATATAILQKKVSYGT